MKIFLLASGLGLLAAVAAVPAAAQSKRSLTIEQVTVQHGDLDLATRADADTMLTRLADAASEACGGRPRLTIFDPLGPTRQHAHRLCKIGAIDAATIALKAALVRAAWLESGEAIRLGNEARRTTSHLLRLAGIGDLAAPPRNY